MPSTNLRGSVLDPRLIRKLLPKSFQSGSKKLLEKLGVKIAIQISKTRGRGRVGNASKMVPLRFGPAIVDPKLGQNLVRTA